MRLEFRGSFHCVDENKEVCCKWGLSIAFLSLDSVLLFYACGKQKTRRNFSAVKGSFSRPFLFPFLFGNLERSIQIALFHHRLPDSSSFSPIFEVQLRSSIILTEALYSAQEAIDDPRKPRPIAELLPTQAPVLSLSFSLFLNLHLGFVYVVVDLKGLHSYSPS
ncbi:hypothetical protein CFP56_015590 [Quercus suber]|uniref:Uncharacterized protein n=1 Tax=Quercus suber TaxID=58331 RepID=A0AAW0KQM9_QUESU